MLWKRSSGNKTLTEDRLWRNVQVDGVAIIFHVLFNASSQKLSMFERE